MPITIENKMFAASLTFKNGNCAFFIMDASSELEAEKIITQWGLRTNLRRSLIVEITEQSIGKLKV